MAGNYVYETKLTIHENGESRVYETKYQNSFTSLEEATHSVAASGTKIIYDPTNESSEATSDFDFLYVHSNTDTELEATTAEGDTTEEMGVVTLKKDLPHTLGSDASRYAHTASDALGGTEGNIDKLRTKDQSGTASVVKVKIFT